MTDYLLDSNTLSDLYELDSSGHGAITRKLMELEEESNLFISVLSLYEFEYGWAKAPDEKKLFIRQRIIAAQADFSVLQLSSKAARLYGSLKAGLRDLRTLKDKGLRSHNVDLMIAATAIAESCTLVSADGLFRDLQKVDPSLKLDDWQR